MLSAAAKAFRRTTTTARLRPAIGQVDANVNLEKDRRNKKE
jgi:hypothetical protein